MNHSAIFRTATIVVVLWFSTLDLYPQKTENQPKLVVGLVVDQMKDDFLGRYSDLYGPDGFNRLLREGFYAANHHFSYMPTYTGPGHASIYAGTTPSVHGIVSNSWYDPKTKRMIYCAEDEEVSPLGVEGDAGKMSPANLKTTNLSDELKLFWNERSKVVGVALKDRGAVLPAGHLADGAYWMSEDMNFVSSSWYFDALPDWVTEFNERKLGKEMLFQNWELLLPESEYGASLPDDNPYETISPGESAPVLPKNLLEIAAEYGELNALANSPFGNTITFDFAKAAIRGEEMGKDDIPDLLSISFSSPDYLGHTYGPRSREVQDAYLRMDLELADFLDFLDAEVGLENCLIFLTADHGGAESAQFSTDRGLPGGVYSRSAVMEELAGMLPEYDLDKLIEKSWESNLNLNPAAVAEAGLDPLEVSRKIAKQLTGIDGIYAAFATADLMRMGEGLFPANFIQRGLYPPLAPDVTWVAGSGRMRYIKTGTTHGSPFSYDTHIPLLIFGKNVEPGKTYRKTYIRDIAPTMSMLLGIPFPSGCTGNPIEEALRK